MDPRKEAASGPGSGTAPRQANDYRPSKPVPLPGAEREAILDDIQANWSRLPTPPSAADVSRWIKAGRRGE